ncbi:hypothetical protein BDV19DRAFT_373567 [Aspergillus venezuelensis]
MAVTYYLLRQFKLKGNTVFRLLHSIFTMKPTYDACPQTQTPIHDTPFSHSAAPQSANTRAETDLLKRTIATLKLSNLARKATATTKNLYHLNNPFFSDSLDFQRTYRTAIFCDMCKVDRSAWERIGEGVSKALMPLLSREKKLCEDGKAARSVTGNLKQISLNAYLAAILKALFDIDDADPERLSYISNTIHNMAVHAKRHTATSSNPSSIPPDLQHDADHLISTLQTIFKEKNQHRPRKDNSLWRQWNKEILQPTWYPPLGIRGRLARNTVYP